MRKTLTAALAAAFVTSLAFAQDVRNTYISLAAQIADGIVTTAKFVSTTGTAGTAVVLATSPVLVTPTLGAAAATSINFGQQALNNYTAGAWTPTLTGSVTPGTGQTYSAQVGSYEQIGRQVTVRWTVVATSLGTAAGNIRVSNLPVTVFNNANDNGECVIGFYTVAGLAALNYGLSGVAPANGTDILIYQNGNAASAALTVAQAGAAFIIQGSCVYRAS